MSRLAENPGSTRQNQQYLNNKLNVTNCILREIIVAHLSKG